MKYGTIPKNYDLEFKALRDILEEKEKKSLIEIERPLKKIGNSYFVQIPIDIAKANNFENIKLKIEDKKASEILNDLMKQIDKQNKNRDLIPENAKTGI
jgi:hypothetical protein